MEHILVSAVSRSSSMYLLKYLGASTGLNIPDYRGKKQKGSITIWKEEKPTFHIEWMITYPDDAK